MDDGHSPGEIASLIRLAEHLEGGPRDFMWGCLNLENPFCGGTTVENEFWVFLCVGKLPCHVDIGKVENSLIPKS